MKKCSIVVLLVWASLNPLSSQVLEDFSDGNFTSAPKWVGSVDQFEISNYDSLHLNDTIAGTAYLSTISTAINEATWEIYLNLQFNPSAANLSRIYLVANRPELDLGVNGYYVNIGGSRDEVSLYRQDSSRHIVVIQGVENRVDSSQVKIRIRATRNQLGRWKLFSDVGNKGAFAEEGAATDNTYPKSAFFGIFCQYTTTRSDNFYFDQINVKGDPYKDTAPPKRTAFELVSDRILKLTFSEPLDPPSAQNSQNFLLIPGSINALRSILIDSASIEVHFRNPFGNGTEHQLVISGIKDDDLNVAARDTVSFRYLPNIPAKYKDLAITEILPDPTPVLGLPETEFVEIHNLSENVFNLQGWILEDETTQGRLDSTLLFPGQYLILCPRDEVSVCSELGFSAGVGPWPSLNNSGDHLRLFSKEGTLVDEASYRRSWHEEEKDGGGYSLEIRDPNSDCPAEVNWGTSWDESGGTPGKINSLNDLGPDQMPPFVIDVEVVEPNLLLVSFSESMDSLSLTQGTFRLFNNPPATISYIDSSLVDKIIIQLSAPLDSGNSYQLLMEHIRDCSGNSIGQSKIEFHLAALPQPQDLKITEIMADPAPSIGLLPEAEYIEIWNASDKFMSTQGLRITDEKDTGKVSSRSLRPGEYLVLTSSSSRDQFDSVITVSSLSKWIGLNQNGMVAIIDKSGHLIDNVEYQSAWSGKARNNGYSLELRDPLYSCNPRMNWTSSISPAGGTPGAKNSVAQFDFDQIPPNIQSTLTLAPDQLILIFDEWMDTASFSFDDFNTEPDLKLAQLQPIAPDTIILVFESELDQAILYHLTIDSVMDCSGNMVDAHSTNFGIGASPERNKLIISEIMADPDPSRGLPEVEYLEIFNNTGNLVSLDGIIINDLTDSTLLPPVMVPPWDYLLLCAQDFAQELNGFGNTLGLAKWLELNNDQDHIQVSFSGNPIFNVHYSRTWYDDFSKENGGCSLEIIDADNPCSGELNWGASTASVGGTPGGENSIKGVRVDHRGPSIIAIYVYSDSSIILEFDEKLDPNRVELHDFRLLSPPGGLTNISIDQDQVQLTFDRPFEPGSVYEIQVDNLTDCVGNLIEPSPSLQSFVVPEAAAQGDIQLSEVLYDPKPGGYDFVELYNNSPKYLDLKGWSLSDNAQMVGPTLESGDKQLIIGPFTYMVFTSNPAAIQKDYIRFDPVALIQSDLPNFPNRTGTVVLTDPLGDTFDSFLYSDDRHFALLRDTEGVSLERVSFDVSTNDPGNWQSALQDFGFASPGLPNSQSRTIVPDDKVIKVIPRVFTPEKGNSNLASIVYQFSNPGKVGTLYVYDVNGRTIKTIARNHFLSASGFFLWDGTDDNLNKVRAGIYVVYLEWFDLDGQIGSAKKTIVVGQP